MSAYVTKPTSACERVSRALSVLLSELHFPTRALGPITEARDLLLRAALDANEFYATERDELVRDVVKLRTELAAAVAERDGLGYYRAEFEPIWDGLQDALEGERQIDSYGLGESEVECVRRVLRERDTIRTSIEDPDIGWRVSLQRWRSRAEQAEARLAAIDSAPTVAYVDGDNIGIECQLQFPAFNYQQQHAYFELIARPAKD